MGRQSPCYVTRQQELEAGVPLRAKTHRKRHSAELGQPPQRVSGPFIQFRAMKVRQQEQLVASSAGVSRPTKKTKVEQTEWEASVAAEWKSLNENRRKLALADAREEYQSKVDQADAERIAPVPRDASVLRTVVHDIGTELTPFPVEEFIEN